MGHDELIAGLRKWTKDHDPHVRAAVGLLIADGFWLGREDFRRAATQEDDQGTAWIAWDRAGAFGRQSGASSSQKAVLALAVSIGADRYRLSRMDDRQAELIVAAFATALGVLGEAQRFQVQEARDALGTWDLARNPDVTSRESVLADQVRALLAIIDAVSPAAGEESPGGD